MVTDDERRRVAERLRAANGPSLMVLMEVLGVDGSHVFSRLADLIEPSIPADPGEAGLACVDAFIREHTEKPVDRDALLALADKVVADTEEDVRSEDLVPAWQAGEALRDVASKIREACGEVVG